MQTNVNGFLSRCASEIEDLARLAEKLDRNLGEVVTASLQGDRGQEMRVLRLEAQGIDLLRQSLEQLQGLLADVARLVPSGEPVDISAPLARLTLRDMADRFVQGPSAHANTTPDPRAPGEGSVHLF